jgi:iron(III) transport system permease protein
MKRLFFFSEKILFVLILSTVAIPLVVIASSWLTPTDTVFVHLFMTGLPEILKNTLFLLLGVAIGSAVLGVSLAWITTAFEFPWRSLFGWALILPLAIPTYVLAFVNIALFDVTGPIQAGLRSVVEPLPFPPIRSTGGVIWVMTLALYPYVYILARNGFLSQGTRAIEVARSLGQPLSSAFFRVALPMARPMIISGLMLVIMETLADFGAVSIFNYDTLTTTIYKAWFSMFSLDTAAKFSSLLVLLVFLLLFLEHKGRQNRRYLAAEQHPTPPLRIHLTGKARITAVLYCGLVLFFAFVLPVTSLLIDAYSIFSQEISPDYIGFLNRSIGLSTLAAGLTTASALFLIQRSFLVRSVRSDNQPSLLIRFATLGYALPGTILAVGGMLFVTFFDRQLKTVTGGGLFLTGTIFAMMLGYLSRFIVLAYNPLESAMHRVTPHMNEAARSLGANRFRIFTKIQIPLLRQGLLTGALFVFVDVMKEMPITLMTRPFGWDTLAVRIFQFTSEGEWDRAAFPAITLVLLGLIPVTLLIRQPRH